MSDDRRLKLRYYRAAWMVAVLLVLYVLSFGPFLGFVDSLGVYDATADRVVSAFYRPLLYVSKLTGTRGLLLDYREWWYDVLRDH